MTLKPELFQRTPQLTGEDISIKREEIRRYFHTTLDRYEQLFETLHNDDAYYLLAIIFLQIEIKHHGSDRYCQRKQAIQCARG